MEFVLYYESELSEEAKRFQDFCDLQEYSPGESASTSRRALYLSHKGLGLITPGFIEPLYIKESKKIAKPFRSNLVRACIPKDKIFSENYSVLDAFSGFGSDGMTLALTRNPVTCVEKDPLIWLILREQLLGFHNVEVKCQDCVVLMREQSANWDTVYLDPMFYQTKKNALPSLELQHLRDLFSDQQEDVLQTLDLARTRARERVVLKRKAKDTQIGKPNFSIAGKLVRFDVYRGEAA